MKIFFDTEFTGLTQSTSLISIGLISETGEAFYAEFTDYDRSQCDRWIEDNVISHTKWLKDGVKTPIFEQDTNTTMVLGDNGLVAKHLANWFATFDNVEIWADCLAYDWVLFCQIFGGAFSIPSNVYYIPFDLATAFKLYGIDSDISRKEYAGIDIDQHNALNDAIITKACYDKLMAQGSAI